MMWAYRLYQKTAFRTFEVSAVIFLPLCTNMTSGNFILYNLFNKNKYHS